MNSMTPFAQASSRLAMPRRDFLLHAATLTTATSLLGLAPGTAAANAPSSTAQRAQHEKILAQLEAEDESMFLVNRAETAVAHFLAHLRGAREILEIGTAHGYWTYWLALAAQARGGRVTTIEIVPERRARALQHLQALGVSHRVTSLEGDAHTLVTTLKKSYDFIFLNADKSGYLDYWRKLYPSKLKPGGLVLAYNYSARLEPMKDFVEAVQATPKVVTAIFHAVPDDVFFAAVDLR
ncbi:MAG: class I SAM-dependent methyltransferase [Verrucomicrobiae bacterium]|nr:class I SAM-dependent methyltransferase [Verrucomicrobiae bacterium]